ncbi:hypothetical protein JKP88DRAFT_251600 [Tribonema minus]|uniref:Zn(2)-C6 fungal-type domain-containing protein n=1 Tax=Tribonema minus TaxID=303371 RepID=A0A835ZIF4_9STRA|nr:hypothetical protein JKP88DRAFT_251600 [Tribonema minus]
MSCARCFRKKTKCDGERPCKTCLERGTDCHSQKRKQKSWKGEGNSASTSIHSQLASHVASDEEPSAHPQQTAFNSSLRTGLLIGAVPQGAPFQHRHQACIFPVTGARQGAYHRSLGGSRHLPTEREADDRSPRAPAAVGYEAGVEVYEGDGKLEQFRDAVCVKLTRHSCCGNRHQGAMEITYPAELHLDIRIGKRDLHSMQECVDVMASSVAGAVRCDTASCTSQTRTVFCAASALPHVLVVLLMRHSNARGPVTKIKHHVSPNGTLHVGVTEYILGSAIFHRGDTVKSGHFFTVARTSEKCWHRFDDDKVLMSALTAAIMESEATGFLLCAYAERHIDVKRYLTKDRLCIFNEFRGIPLHMMRNPVTHKAPFCSWQTRNWLLMQGVIFDEKTLQAWVRDAVYRIHPYMWYTFPELNRYTNLLPAEIMAAHLQRASELRADRTNFFKAYQKWIISVYGRICKVEATTWRLDNKTPLKKRRKKHINGDEIFLQLQPETLVLISTFL